jgi:hypothetical protein
MKTTDGHHEVPAVHDGQKSLVTFTCGARGSQEAGRYAFWTGILRVENGIEQGYTVRSREHLRPGERDDVPPDDPHFDDVRQGLRDCLFVRPASLPEIESWLQGHRTDAAFATEADVGGKRYRVEGLRLVSTS